MPTQGSIVWFYFINCLRCDQAFLSPLLYSNMPSVFMLSSRRSSSSSFTLTISSKCNPTFSRSLVWRDKGMPSPIKARSISEFALASPLALDPNNRACSTVFSFDKIKTILSLMLSGRSNMITDHLRDLKRPLYLLPLQSQLPRLVVLQHDPGFERFSAVRTRELELAGAALADQRFDHRVG